MRGDAEASGDFLRTPALLLMKVAERFKLIGRMHQIADKQIYAIQVKMRDSNCRPHA